MRNARRELEEKLKKKVKLVKDYTAFPSCGYGEVVTLGDVLETLNDFIVVSKEWLEGYCDRCGGILDCQSCHVPYLIQELLGDES